MIAAVSRAGAVFLLLAGGVLAQQFPSRYEMQFGEPVDVSIEDLVRNGSAYEGRAVRTKGRLDLVPGSLSRAFSLRGGFGDSVRIVPMPDVAFYFEQEAGMRWLGQEIQVTGVYDRQSSPGVQLPDVIQFWSFVGPPDPKDLEKAAAAPSVTLEALVSKPGSRDGQMVRVVGQFRGHNLYGDLPVRSRRASSDWVIKDDLYAVWVTGGKPKGRGWSLDPGFKRDTGKWIEVVGRPSTRGGVTYIEAVKLELSSAPAPTAQAQPPPPPPERPKLPPVVVFALPLDGESEVTTDSRFVVQFSKDMDEKTFDGRVLLRYVGGPRPGERGFDGAKMSYDRGRRALTVEPGDLLRPGRQLELLLLPGIVDIDGLALIPRPGKQVDVAVDVLRYQVGF